MSQLSQTRRWHFWLSLTGCLLLATSLVRAYWPKSTEVLIPVYEGTDGAVRCGYINEKGQVAHPFQWERADSFSKDGLAGVTIKTDKGPRWGAIDRKGNVVVPYQWMGAFGFFDSGYAITVSENKKWGVIDQQGKVVVPHEWDRFNPVYPQRGTGYFEYVDSHGWIKVTRNRQRDPSRYGMIDLQGKIVIPLEFDELSSFDSHGLAVATQSNKSGWINRQGKWVIPPVYESNCCRGFDEQGWAGVTSKGKGGYIDTQGKTVLPFQWEICDEFHPHGYARAWKDSKGTLINREGKEVIPLHFNDCTYEDDGLVVVHKAGKVGLIDLQGNILIPFQYSRIKKAYKSPHRVAWLQNSNQCGLIDNSGNVLIDFKWVFVTVFIDAGQLFYRCENDAESPWPAKLMPWVNKVYGWFGKKWSPSKLVYVYNEQLQLIWASDSWFNYLNEILGSLGVACMLVGVWQYRRNTKRITRLGNAA